MNNELKRIEEILRGNDYPGRGIAAGRTPDGRYAACIYFIMGRSENSRNRIFVNDGSGIRTQAFDESKMSDPSLIIYSPVRVLGNTHIITNGDQTDTVFEGLSDGLTFEQSLRSRRYEPDPPNYTPRISVIVEPDAGELDMTFSILKSDEGDPDSDLRYTFSYSRVRPGEGRFISTYRHDGNPLPSFSGEPVHIAIEDDQAKFTESVWESLNADNKVSLFTRYVDLETGRFNTMIINKNLQ